MKYLGKTKLYKIFEHYFGSEVPVEEFKYTVGDFIDADRFSDLYVCS